MDCIASPKSVTSPTTEAPAGLPTKQPTYTTAGTVYDPRSSQPLQAPARRGRSFKWANGGINTDLALLPKSVLASLPLRAAAVRTPVLQQYSPLQQNYDRAISPSPFHEPDHIPAKMPLEGALTPMAHPATPLPSLFAGSSEDKSTHEDASDESDSDSELGMDPLLGMTVKSLQNLASYPNPNQKKARKALRGAKPSLQPLGVNSRGHISPKANSIPPIGSPPKSGMRTLERPQSTTPGLVQPKRPFPSSHDGSENGLIVPMMTPHDGLGRSLGVSAVNPKPKSSTLADGPGAPRPLTAGPPGQRQYRPSTFESTFKALQSKIQQSAAETASAQDKIWTVQGPHSHMPVSVEDEGKFPRLTPSSCAAVNRSDSPSAHSVAASQKGTHDARGPSADASAILEHLQRQESLRLARESALAAHEQKEPLIPNLRDERPQNQQRFETGTDRLSLAEIKSRNERMDRIWYSGSGLLSKSTTEAIADEKHRRLQQSLGAIGDGRPVKQTHHYQTIDMESANKATSAEHALPLLNLAFAGLLRYCEERQ